MPNGSLHRFQCPLPAPRDVGSGSLADILGLDERDSWQITTKSSPRNPSCSSLETKAVRDGQLDQAVLSRDRGFQIVAILRTPDPDLAAVQAAELLARSAHIAERHVAQVRNECR
jgi:hypothetical protein